MNELKEIQEEQENHISVDLEDEYREKGGGNFGKPSFPAIRKVILGASAAVLTASIVVSGLFWSSGRKSDESVFPTLQILAELPPRDRLPGADSFAPHYTAEPFWTEHTCIRTNSVFSTERNEHFIGWFQLGELRVNEPVVQKTDEQYAASGATPSYYLNRTFDGRAGSDLGTMFVDRRTPIVDSRRPDNMVIYGHNIPNIPNRKFAFLINYYTNFLETYRNYPTFQFTTIYSEVDDPRNTYLIFAGTYVNVHYEHGQVFDYFRRRFFDDNGRWGNARDEFFDFIGNVMDRSNFVTDVDIQFGDEIVTLSTCHRPLDRLGSRVNSRYALFARRLRPGEDLSSLNIEAAHLNPSPLYFDEFYARMGGEWEGRGWNTSLVRGFDEWLAGNPRTPWSVDPNGDDFNWCSTRPVPRGEGWFEWT
jgi:hypothetical protein